MNEDWIVIILTKKQWNNFIKKYWKKINSRKFCFIRNEYEPITIVRAWGSEKEMSDLVMHLQASKASCEIDDLYIIDKKGMI